MCSIVSKKIALSSEEWTVGQILSACKLFVYSFLTSFIANEPDKEVVAWATLPVFTKVKEGPINALIGPSLTLVNTGSVAQATTSLSGSLAMNEVKKEYTNNLQAERICPTVHSSELNAIFFETIEHTGCYYDPLSILR